MEKGIVLRFINKIYIYGLNKKYIENPKLISFHFSYFPLSCGSRSIGSCHLTMVKRIEANMETKFNFEIWGFEIKIKQLKFIPIL